MDSVAQRPAFEELHDQVVAPRIFAQCVDLYEMGWETRAIVRASLRNRSRAFSPPRLA